MPTPPIPEELRGRMRVLYGCKITNAHIERYIQEEGINNVPEDAYSRRRFKFALLRTVAEELHMGLLITHYHMIIPGKPNEEPDEDMVYWSYGRFGRFLHPKVPPLELVKVFMSKLHIYDAEAEWH